MIVTKPATPIFRSFDETKSKEFYLKFLGFDIVFEHRFEENTPLYMGLRLDSFTLHLSEHHGDATPGSSVRVEIENVNEFCKALNKKKYKYAKPGVIRQDWGFDEMVITDPSGNRLIFCTEISR